MLNVIIICCHILIMICLLDPTLQHRVAKGEVDAGAAHLDQGQICIGQKSSSLLCFLLLDVEILLEDI